MVLTENDRRLARSVRFQIGTGEFINRDDPREGRVSFQFPPKILSDSRSGSWDEGGAKGILGMEPFKVFTSANERTFALSWSYIIDNAPGATWDSIRVKNEINRIRGYFSNLLSDRTTANQNKLIVNFNYPLYTGPKTWTCRVTSVDVKYGDCLVTDGFVHPLRTDITADMRLWVYPNFGGLEEGLVQEIRSIRLNNNPRFTDLWY
jgi:hypothetical protein